MHPGTYQHLFVPLNLILSLGLGFGVRELGPFSYSWDLRVRIGGWEPTPKERVNGTD